MHRHKNGQKKSQKNDQKELHAIRLTSAKIIHSSKETEKLTRQQRLLDT